MIRVMAAAEVLKGGGSLWLSWCSRGGGPLPLLCTGCSTSFYPQVKGKGKGNIYDGILTRGRLSLSRSGKRTTAVGARRLFCTASNVADSSASTATSLAASSNEDEDDGDLMMIKDAANTLDIRVGHILRAWRHEEADSLYVEEVDVGEPQARIICSGLVNYIPPDNLQDKKVVVLTNLKPRNMRGVKSYGMLMAASDASHQTVELLAPPEGSLPGERIWFGSADEKENLPDAATPNQIQKKKIWELVQPHLKTDASCVAVLGMHSMRTSAGVVACSSLRNANIS